MEWAANIKNFKLLSLVGSFSKLIVEMLARRIAKVMKRVMSEYQHAFVEGRQILDAALIANDMWMICYIKNGRVSYISWIWRKCMII